MPEKDLITLLSLDDAAKADIIKSRLETEGISCFMKAGRKNSPSPVPSTRPIDLRVYMKDLDRALTLISDDYAESKNLPENNS